MSAVDWGPAEQEPNPEPEVDGELACLYALRLILRDREERMRRAREAMRRAADVFFLARDEFNEWAGILEQEAAAYASQRGGSHGCK